MASEALQLAQQIADERSWWVGCDIGELVNDAELLADEVELQAARIAELEAGLGNMLRRGDGKPSACTCAACAQARALLEES